MDVFDRDYLSGNFYLCLPERNEMKMIEIIEDFI